LEDFLEGWRANADIFRRGTQARDLSTSLKGDVHPGFARLTAELWPEFMASLSQVPPRSELWLTGHSQGGALAVLAAAKLKAEGRTISGVYTFGAPRVGDTRFASVYTPRVIRFELADDIIPLLPPTGILRDALNVVLGAISDDELQIGPTEYRHVGKLRFIDWEGRYYADAQDLVARRAQRLLAIYARARSRLVRDHLLPRYATAIIREISLALPISSQTIDDDPHLIRMRELIKAPESLQQLFDGLSEIAIAGRADAIILGRLIEIANYNAQLPDGQLKANWEHIQQAALWTLGIVNRAYIGGMPVHALAGIKLVANMFLEDDLYPMNVCVAAVQCLQAFASSDDPIIRALLSTARYSVYADVKEFAIRALNGETIR
jgi:predicted lipase